MSEQERLKASQIQYAQEDDLDALRAENQRLKEALQGMLQLVDDGLLVRNTANDNMTGWGILALPIVRAVQRANEALQPKRGKP